MANIGRPPCDEDVICTSRALAPCTRAAAPWVLAATIIGSAMAERVRALQLPPQPLQRALRWRMTTTGSRNAPQPTSAS